MSTSLLASFPIPSPKSRVPTTNAPCKNASAIEPTIGHLKSDYSLARNYLKGFLGDSLNLLLAAAAGECQSSPRLSLHRRLDVVSDLYRKLNNGHSFI